MSQQSRSGRGRGIPAQAPARRPLAHWIAAALALGAMQAAHAGTPPVLSAAWLAQRQNLSVSTTTGTSSAATGVSGLSAQTSGQLLQQKVVQQSIANLSNAAQAVAAQMAAQRQAAQKAQALTTTPVPNGLTPGGLQVAANGTWQNINAPTQSAAGGQVTVEVKQTAQKAIATWDSFNVGRQTTVHFDQTGGAQSSGANDWIVLNRILDPSGVPSQIFGQIKAEGSVYLINRNGILFGAGSQVNTHAFLASSLDLFSSDAASSNSRFTSGGISDLASTQGVFTTDGILADLPKYGTVTIEQGASITTGAQGFALVAAPNVSNAGSVVADDGQAILAAGIQFDNRDGSVQGGTLDLYNTFDGRYGGSVAASTYPAGGAVSNTGLVEARRGSVSMLGHDVDQAGVALASTSISYPGSIELVAQDAASDYVFQRGGTLTLAPGSVTAVLPEEDGATTTSGQAADDAFQAGSVTLSGGAVNIQSGSLLEAPGADLSITAQLDSFITTASQFASVPSDAGRIYVDAGAVIDVSGLADVDLPMSALLVSISRIGQNELADSPLLRNSFLYTQKNLVVDSTRSGTRADGLDWVGSPILNVSGYVEDVPRTIDQMLVKGGSVSLAGDQVIVRSGAQLNLDGGYVAYQPGWVSTPNLLGADGRIYNLADADPDVSYVGFAGQYTMEHSRWGVSETWSNPLLGGTTRYDSGFVMGGDAGSLTVAAGKALVLDGEIDAQAFAGRNQVAQNDQPAGGSLNVGNQAFPILSGTHVVNQELGLLLSATSTDLDQLVSGFAETSDWNQVLTAQDATATSANDLRLWLPVPVDLISKDGFQSVSLDTRIYSSTDSSLSSTTPILEQAGADLAVRPGGSISLTGSRLTVLGTLSAPAGSIALTSNSGLSYQDSLAGTAPSGDIVIGHGALLDVAGLWVNDSGLAASAVAGDRYVDGGSISLETDLVVDNSHGGADATGAIRLEAGSLLDASGGGYVAADGELALSDGVPEGHGGDVSLVSHYVANGSANVSPADLDGGALVLDGELRAYGFSGGGTLSLQAPQIQIGGDPADLALASGLYLAPAFFAGQGFASYQLTATTDATIAADTVLRVSNDNLLPNYQALLVAPTGSDLYADGLTSLGQLDAYHRYVTSGAGGGDGATPGFSLRAGGYLNWYAGGVGTNSPSYAGVTGSLLMGEGADILADAGATVALAGTQQTTVLGRIVAPGGSIALTVADQLTKAAGLPARPYQVWLGAKAVLDASGTSLVDPWAAAVTAGDGTTLVPRTGTVLDGGEVSLTGDMGYVLAQAGSVIDVSGAADTYDLPQAATTGPFGAGVDYPATAVWSDAGSITLAAAAGLYVDSALQAHGGAAQAEGGSLTLVGLTNTRQTFTTTGILLQQSGDLLPADLQLGQSPEASPSGLLHFAADRLRGSGIASLAIGPSPSEAPSGNNSEIVVPLGFAGDVDLDLGKSFIANASAYIALPAGSTTLATKAGRYAQGNGTVTISAPYVYLAGTSAAGTAPVARAGDGVLDVNADFVDLGGVLDLQQWADAHFTSSGDLRFYLPPIYAYRSGVRQPGLLFTTGNLSFEAAQLYPASDYAFVIDANPSGLKDAQGQALSTTVSILPNGNSTVPLSAGGALLLDAGTIEQTGTLRVPSGDLVLGVSDPAAALAALGLSSSAFPLFTTTSAHLGAGSITSVSLDGATVPYGATVDGTDWRYGGDPNTDSSDLDAPPAKQITIGGTKVALDAGATIDLSGGGSLQAQEWVPGTGGTRDMLSQTETDYSQSTAGVQVPQYADGRAIYAILPGYSASVGAHDAALEKGAGDGPAVGESVYLSGINGLPPGYYTLLPAKYATLPGAYRVVQDTSSLDSVIGRNAVLPDGTLAVTGYFADALSGARQARSTTFLVQSGSVWQQYSQYTLKDADSYFASQASEAGELAPSLPQDAGHLILEARQQLDLGTTLTASPAVGGRGAEVDIAAQAIAVVAPGQGAPAGYLAIDADGLSTLGAASLLLGGTRSDSSDGEQVDTVADSLLVANDAANPLAGPEILLVANGGGSAGASGLALQSGSAIVARGAASGAASEPLIFGSDASTDTNGNAVAAVNGDGALLRVSQNGAAPVERHDTDDKSGALTIEADASVAGGSALTLDATGAMQVDPAATLGATAIDANAGLITFAGAGATVAPVSAGLVIGPATLALFNDAQMVTLRSRSAIDFAGDVGVDLPGTLELDAGALTSDGGAVSLSAGTLALGNGLGAGVPAFAAGAGSLALHAGEIDMVAGSATLRGFGSVTAAATQGMRGQGTGSFDFGNLDVDLSTPVFIARSGAATTLTTTGALVFGGGGTGTLSSAGEMGGALTMSGGTLTVNTSLEAPAGDLSLTATTGELNVGGAAVLDTAGVNKTFYDTVTYAPGGALSLAANAGNVNLAAGSSLRFGGAAQGGAAGSLSIEAAGSAILAGSLDGHASHGYAGGSFTLSTGGAVDLVSLVQLLDSTGIDAAVSVNSGAGNLILPAGRTLAADSVYLAANGGSGAPGASDGNVVVDGSIDVSGTAAGSIELYGRNGVDVEGSLLAVSSTPEQQGGSVTIGTGGLSDGTLNSRYGYQNVQPGDSGTIRLGTNARIDVSSGADPAGLGLSLIGGSISFRAPLLANGDVAIALDGQLAGARQVIIEPYAVWSSTDASTGAQHFDGLVDPAGWYQSQGAAGGTAAMVAGTWTNGSGTVLAAPADAATLATYLENDYFTPDTANADHVGFYGYQADGITAGTLMGYVQHPGFGFGGRYAGIANLQLRPGIQLENPTGGPNGGTVSVLTNWNLGAGTTNADGSITLAYRYQGQAPMLTVLAAGDLDIQASITDGFYQQNDGAKLDDPTPPATGNSDSAYDDALAAYTSALDPTTNAGKGIAAWNTGTINLKKVLVGGGTANIAGDKYYEAVSAPLTDQSDDYYANYESYLSEVRTWAGTFYLTDSPTASSHGFLWYTPTTLTAPDPANYTSYSDYASAYLAWLKSNFPQTAYTKAKTTPSPLLEPIDGSSTSYDKYSQDYAEVYLPDHSTYYLWVYGHLGTALIGSQLYYAPFSPAADPAGTGVVTQVPVPASAADNSPSNMPSLGSPASLASATLLGGSSTSYRLVAGADLSAPDPLTVAAGGGSVNLDGHFAAVDTATTDEAGNAINDDPVAIRKFDNKTLLFPTVIRTGTGSIDIAASGDIDWLDSAAPSAIYTAGEPAAGTTADTSVTVLRPIEEKTDTSVYAIPDMLVTGGVNPVKGGDIKLSAGGDIDAIQAVYDTDGSVTGVKGTYIGQYWWPWMQTGNAADGSRSSINFAAFDQGVMSAGGNVSVSASGTIHELSVSLPTTWYVNADGSTVTTVGGGNLAVSAGGDILSGSYFVAKGSGLIEAGGLIGADFDYTTPSTVTTDGYAGLTTPVATVLGLQDAQMTVDARQGVDLGGVYNPSYMNLPSALLPARHADSQSYSADSALNVTATDGDVALDSLSVPSLLFDYGDTSLSDAGSILPAALALTALDGDLDILGSGGLYPSADGNLSLLAGGSIALSNQVYSSNANVSNFGLIDAPASLLPSPLAPYGTGHAAQGSDYAGGTYIDVGNGQPGTTSSAVLHQADSLHGGDDEPVRVYALNGDITDGIEAANGFQYASLALVPSKQALVYAGHDIVDLSFVGQQVHDADVTRIAAGHDIYDTDLPTKVLTFSSLSNNYELIPSLLLGGVGSFIVEAGHNIGPLANEQEIATNSSISAGSSATGIEAIGNAGDPYLPHQSADLSVLFGVGPGIATGAFISAYLDPAGGIDGFGSLLPDLVSFMEAREEGRVVDTGYAQDKITVSLTPEQARAAFDQLPDYEQQMFAERELFKMLTQVGADYNDPASPYFGQYARGYAALGTLFPASLGYTDNGGGQGGFNGAAQTVDTGDLDIRGTTIQTQQGGNVTILGPGGQALVGSTSAPQVITNSAGQVVAGPNTMGVLTLEQGSVNIFTDRSLLLAQSRIFTEQGGDMTIWSSNGDINAGQGAKTTSEIPPPDYLCTIDAYCLLDAKGQVSGAGIATLQSIPGAPTGNVYLVAPRGTVDAGDAGIRVSGNIVIAAARVLNADNIQVQGEKIGIPVVASVNTSALTAASAAASAVGKVADDMARQQQNDARSNMPSIISVQVLGFGGGDSGASVQGEHQGPAYDADSPVQVLGAGRLGDKRKAALTTTERQRLTQ